MDRVYVYAFCPAYVEFHFSHWETWIKLDNKKNIIWNFLVIFITEYFWVNLMKNLLLYILFLNRFWFYLLKSEPGQSEYGNSPGHNEGIMFQVINICSQAL